jgi:osmotically-inducible protein OsmY
MTHEPRPDIDIEEDIRQIIGGFAPLKASRGYFEYRSHQGIVVLTGNIRSPQARRVLLDNIPRVPGVKGCEAGDLFDDEAVKFKVAQLLPPGLFANVHYGTVGITGKLPEGASAETIREAISAVPGVRRVAMELQPAK